MAIAHVYRIVNCKSCGSQIDVEYLGPAQNVRIAGTITTPGQIRCFKCSQSHEYSYFDIQLFVKQHPPNRKR